MKLKKILIATSLSMLSFLTIATLAADEKPNHKKDVLIQKMQRLEAELHNLRKEMRAIKTEQKEAKSTQITKEEKEDLKIMTSFLGAPVVTSPYLGIRSRLDQSNLIVNLPYINQDLRLLEQRQALDKAHIERRGQAAQEIPVLAISGTIEAQTWYSKPSNMRSTSDINITDAELDFVAFAHPWAIANLGIKYDNGSISEGERRVSNSRLFVDRAFITIGNLSELPLYGTIGQMYVPFGRYFGEMITAPLPRTLFRTKARALLLGYKQPGDMGLFASIFAFKGETKIGNASNSAINRFGANAGYAFDVNNVTGEVGASYINSIAESDGMQNNGLGGGVFAGFNRPASNQILQHRVGGYSVRGKAEYNNFGAFAEYITADRAFHTMDMQFNGTGARPAALDAEAYYNFKILDRRSGVAVGYGKTRQALALNVPEQRYSVSVKHAFNKNVLGVLEYRYEKDYAAGTTSSGSSIPGRMGTGANNNVITAKVNVYW